MNKKDFWTLIGCDIVVLILLIEHWCGLDLALECMCVTAIISALVHIHILRDYVIVNKFVRKDYTDKRK